MFRPPCRAKEAAAVMAEREKFEEQRGQMEEYSRQLNELSRTINSRSIELAAAREQVDKDQENMAVVLEQAKAMKDTADELASDAENKSKKASQVRAPQLRTWTIIQPTALITSECGATRYLSIKWP